MLPLLLPDALPDSNGIITIAVDVIILIIIIIIIINRSKALDEIYNLSIYVPLFLSLLIGEIFSYKTINFHYFEVHYHNSMFLLDLRNIIRFLLTVLLFKPLSITSVVSFSSHFSKVTSN